MSSAEVMVGEAVVASTTVRGDEARWSATVVGVIAAVQLTWLGALAYGVVSLLT